MTSNHIISDEQFGWNCCCGCIMGLFVLSIILFMASLAFFFWS